MSSSRRGGVKNQYQKQRFQTSSSSSSSSSTLSDEKKIEVYIEQAENLLSSFQPKQALILLNQAIQLKPNDVNVLDLLAQTYLELDQLHQAIQAYEKSCKLAPNHNSSKWLTLGQLHKGKESLKCYHKGIQLLQTEKKELEQIIKSQSLSTSSSSTTTATTTTTTTTTTATQEQEEELSSLCKAISDAYCSIAEIYTTDCCDEPEAESECERVLQLAVGSCAKNPEAFYGLVNLRLIQGKKQDADKYLQRCLKLLSEMPINEIEDLSYEFQMDVAKSCLELNHFQQAAQLFEQLLQSDDQVVEVWYYAAFAYFHANEYSAAQQYITNAAQLMEQAPDEELQMMISQLQEQITKYKQEHPEVSMETEEKEDEADGTIEEEEDDDEDDQEEKNQNNENNDDEMQ